MNWRRGSRRLGIVAVASYWLAALGMGFSRFGEAQRLALERMGGERWFMLDTDSAEFKRIWGLATQEGWSAYGGYLLSAALLFATGLAGLLVIRWVVAGFLKDAVSERSN